MASEIFHEINVTLGQGISCSELPAQSIQDGPMQFAEIWKDTILFLDEFCVMLPSGGSVSPIVMPLEQWKDLSTHLRLGWFVNSAVSLGLKACVHARPVRQHGFQSMISLRISLNLGDGERTPFKENRSYICCKMV
uniref:Uncharacterized protein n=1 Tax=Coccidioides posadasii RMSCC 3488 TaxID=454284 RepID=A0A0J6ID88_COCPO|nr:hypothetical protein CPAG_05986 [Coccidioides posadasii RMSCC 3488]